MEREGEARLPGGGPRGEERTPRPGEEKPEPDAAGRSGADDRQSAGTSPGDGGQKAPDQRQEHPHGSSRGEGGDDGQSKDGGKEQPSRAEWVVGILCSVVVLVAVGYLFYRALTGPSLPPLVTVEAERILPAGRGYLVELRIVNEGTGTAANLTVEGALMQDTVAVEKSTATIAFVPAETERRGGLFFTKDPRRYRLDLRPTGYDRP